MNKHIKSIPDEISIAEFFKLRWSSVAFSNEVPSDEELSSIFTAGSWVSSSMNEQPWRFVIAKHGTELFDSFCNVLAPANQQWACNAGVLIAVLVENNFSKTQSLNIHAWHDVGAAQAYMLLEAAQLGIYGHQMGGFDKEQARELLKLNPSMDIICFMALGYIDTNRPMDENLQKRESTPRTRKPLESFVFNAIEDIN